MPDAQEVGLCWFWILAEQTFQEGVPGFEAQSKCLCFASGDTQAPQTDTNDRNWQLIAKCFLER